MFEDRGAIVTGAATGLGETIAGELLRRGAHVTVVDVNGEGVRELAARLDPSGERCQAVEADVADPRAVERMVARAVERFGAHGIVGLTRAAALDYAPRGIRITAIGPGYTDTPEMRKLPEDVRERFAQAHPLGRLATRQEVADTVAFLLSDEASFITGSFHLMDGGLTAR